MPFLAGDPVTEAHWENVIESYWVYVNGFRFNFYPSGIFRMNSSDRFSGSGPHTTGKCFAMGINAINAIARSITGSVLAVSYGNLALDGPTLGGMEKDGDLHRSTEVMACPSSSRRPCGLCSFSIVFLCCHEIMMKLWLFYEFKWIP